MEEEMELPEGKTELYLALADTIKKFHFDVQPLFFEASSDLRFHLARNIDGLGFTPFTVADNIHGTDEAVPVDQIIKGKNIIYQFLKDFCAPPG
jgi:acetylornithine deacetylase/succinyl-diaminopimelate desuccinylase-like protein